MELDIFRISSDEMTTRPVLNEYLEMQTDERVWPRAKNEWRKATSKKFWNSVGRLEEVEEYEVEVEEETRENLEIRGCRK